MRFARATNGIVRRPRQITRVLPRRRITSNRRWYTLAPTSLRCENEDLRRAAGMLSKGSRALRRCMIRSRPENRRVSSAIVPYLWASLGTTYGREGRRRGDRRQLFAVQFFWRSPSFQQLPIRDQAPQATACYGAETSSISSNQASALKSSRRAPIPPSFPCDFSCTISHADSSSFCPATQRRRRPQSRISTTCTFSSRGELVRGELFGGGRGRRDRAGGFVGGRGRSGGRSSGEEEEAGAAEEEA